MTRIPEHMLHIPAIVEDATSQPSGRFSILRPRMALRMMINGPAKTPKENLDKKSEQVFARKGKFWRLSGDKLIKATENTCCNKARTRDISNEKKREEHAH